MNMMGGNRPDERGANARLIRVMCGRRLIDKSFFSLMQHWSGAVMCPGPSAIQARPYRMSAKPLSASAMMQ
jgi:hypothetical protein